MTGAPRRPLRQPACATGSTISPRRDRLAVMRPDVALRFELAAIAKRLDGSKATLFPRPAATRCRSSPGSCPTARWIAEAMGVDAGEMLARFQDAASIRCRGARSRSAPVQEVVHRTRRSRRRCCRCRRITSTTAAPTSPPASSSRAIRRPAAERRDPPAPAHRTEPARRADAAAPHHAFPCDGRGGGQPLAVAIVIGVDPLTLLASQAIVPLDHDELEIAGALHGRAAPVVKCLTSDIRVPAEAEIVIEGRICRACASRKGRSANSRNITASAPTATSSRSTR